MMDQKKINALRLLEAIEKKQTQSQRDLSSNLNISLGLVNAFIRSMAKKGLFNISTLPKSRIKYIMTPAGLAEKANLTSQYIQYSVSFYKEIQKRLRDIFNDLSKDGVKNVVLYGAGELSEIALSVINGTDLQIVQLVDNAKAGKTILGVNIYELDCIQKTQYDAVLIMEIENDETIACLLNDHGIPEEKIRFLTDTKFGGVGDEGKDG